MIEIKYLIPLHGQKFDKNMLKAVSTISTTFKVFNLFVTRENININIIIGNLINN